MMRITIRVTHVRQLFLFVVARASACGSIEDHHLRGLRFVFGRGFVNCRYYIVFVVSEPLWVFFHDTWTWLPLEIGILKNEDGKCNDHATNQWYDWLNNEKWSCCNYGKRCSIFFGCNLPNDNVRSSNSGFRRQREPGAINHSFFVFIWKPIAPSKRRDTTSNWSKMTNAG